MLKIGDKLAIYGQWTYRAAWALEITAALIGLATGLVLGYQAYTANTSVTAVELTLASAPFFMVALAELTKIPIATLLFAASWKWKLILTLFLGLLALITFETVFMGLERAATLRQLQYEEFTKRIAVLSAESSNIDATIERDQKTDEVREAQQNIERISALAAQERQTLQQQIDDADKELKDQIILSPDALRSREKLVDRQNDRTKLIEEREVEIEDRVGAFERQRESFERRIADARKDNDAELARQLSAELLRLPNPRKGIEATFAPQIQRIDAEIEQLRTAFEKQRDQGTRMGVEQRQTIERRRDAIIQTFAKVNQKWGERLEQARSQLATAQNNEFTEGRRVSEGRERQGNISKELSQIESDRIPMARTDQVRRIAARVYGTNPEEVTVEQAALIALIWFGSLAALAALAGPLTAMVALGLQNIAARTADNPETKLSKTLRRAIVNWRWRRTKKIPFRVEVPVEKIVEKPVEVMVEKVVKEILYIPLLTDDPAAVKRALTDAIPDEIVNLVKITTKDAPRASET